KSCWHYNIKISCKSYRRRHSYSDCLKNFSGASSHPATENDSLAGSFGDNVLYRSNIIKDIIPFELLLSEGDFTP
ncbi:MAG: hypothetical protein QXH80_01410, partial [Candidatus Nanoarchaeia archaeon]